MKILSDYLRTLLPDFWLMNYPFSRSWDSALNRLLDQYKFTNITPYQAALGEAGVWIENFPYAAFTPRIEGKTQTVRPSRSTIAKASRQLKRDSKVQYDQRFKFDDILSGVNQ